MERVSNKSPRRFHVKRGIKARTCIVEWTGQHYIDQPMCALCLEMAAGDVVVTDHISARIPITLMYPTVRQTVQLLIDRHLVLLKHVIARAALTVPELCMGLGIFTSGEHFTTFCGRKRRV